MGWKGDLLACRACCLLLITRGNNNVGTVPPQKRQPSDVFVLDHRGEEIDVNYSS